MVAPWWLRGFSAKRECKLGHCGAPITPIRSVPVPELLVACCKFSTIRQYCHAEFSCRLGFPHGLFWGNADTQGKFADTWPAPNVVQLCNVVSLDLTGGPCLERGFGIFGWGFVAK